MRLIRNGSPWALVLGLALMNGGCMLIPEIKERIVELAVGGSITQEFVSLGSVNVIDATSSVDVASGFDLAQVLADAGIDVSDAGKIAVSGVEYRIAVADPDTDRVILNAAVTVARNGSGELPFVSSFDTGAAEVTDWRPAPLDPSGAGMAEINQMLRDILAALKLGTSPPPNLTTLTYHVTGQVRPSLSPTNFAWELKIKIIVTGTVKVDVPT